jgi:hypothetical protein
MMKSLRSKEAGIPTRSVHRYTQVGVQKKIRFFGKIGFLT